MDALRLKFLSTLSTGYQNPISIIISVLLVSTSRLLGSVLLFMCVRGLQSKLDIL